MNPLLFILDIILAGVTLFYSGFILLHLISWKKLQAQNTNTHKLKTKISILIPARNEEKNIGICIASILAQDYPKELTVIIVCDDHSEDNTKDEALKMLRHSGVITNTDRGKHFAIE